MKKKNKISIEGPDGKKHSTEVYESPEHTNLLNFLYAGVDFLKAMGVAPEISNQKTRILVGDIPTKKIFKKEGKEHHIYSSFIHEYEGLPTIFVDDSLSPEESLAQTMHETIHILHPGYSEHEVQVASAKYLKELVNRYETLSDPRNVQNLKNYGVSKMPSKRELSQAYEELVSSGVYGLERGEVEKGPKRGLERRLGVFLLIASGIIFAKQAMLTGAVIGKDVISSNSWGLVGIFLGIILLVHGIFKKDKSSRCKEFVLK